MSQTKSTPIKMPDHISEKLSSLDKRRKIFEVVVITAVILSVITIGIASYMALDFMSSMIDRVMIAIFAGIIVGYPINYSSYELSLIVEPRWFPSFYIEEDGDVLKLWGGVRMSDWGYVTSKMLAMRPGYMLVGDAHSQFGCTMAAVPANKL